MHCCLISLYILLQLCCCKKTSHRLLIATASGFHLIINFFFFLFWGSYEFLVIDAGLLGGSHLCDWGDLESW